MSPHLHGQQPLNFAQIINLLRLSATTQNPSLGRSLHAHILKTGLHNSSRMPNTTLIGMYDRCALLPEARQVFDEMSHRDAVSLASMLTAYTHSGHADHALTLFASVSAAGGIELDDFMYATLARACGSVAALRQGKQVHANFVTSDWSHDDVAKSALVDMYARCGCVDDARGVFDSMSSWSYVARTAMINGYSRNGRFSDAICLFRRFSDRNVVSWTALISGFVQNGDGCGAFSLFNEMRSYGVAIDPFVLSCVVGGSANMAALELGRQFHSLVVKCGFETSMVVCNSLIDMYAKCSNVVAASKVFDMLPQRDVVSWTTMIVGLAQHGRPEDAFGLFRAMVDAGMKPNQVTFVGLLYACSHAGLVEEGRRIFSSMSKDHGIKPVLQHYTCMLDLLGRAGLLDEAEEVVRSMPMEPDEASWASLLSACLNHGATKMGIKIADHLLNLDPEDPSTYILLSNAYAASGMWDQMSRVRRLMAARDVKKQPGYSWVELGKGSHVFYAGDVSHPMKEEILALLSRWHVEMKKRGYVPDTSFVLHDLEQQEKEQQLFLHSERLAIAYGFLKAAPGTAIRIVKNLRICGDCHTVIKLICSIICREIIVRDATRFHHFKSGKCSCGDFW
ncbi:Pentatricopeptide repeat-containing protein [Nymphaea thermarum]|nr:Pentatricopeptide repeat-containing protein [Nymphaea thermarum]